MDPVMLNTILTYISNYLYSNLKEKEFFNLGLFLSLLSKEMLEMNVIRDLCKWEKEVEKEKREERK